MRKIKLEDLKVTLENQIKTKRVNKEVDNVRNKMQEKENDEMQQLIDRKVWVK